MSDLVVDPEDLVNLPGLCIQQILSMNIQENYDISIIFPYSCKSNTYKNLTFTGMPLCSGLLPALI